jgi:hypothetical protein
MGIYKVDAQHAPQLKKMISVPTLTFFSQKSAKQTINKLMVVVLYHIALMPSAGASTAEHSPDHDKTSTATDGT